MISGCANLRLRVGDCDAGGVDYSSRDNIRRAPPDRASFVVDDGTDDDRGGRVGFVVGGRSRSRELVFLEGGSR